METIMNITIYHNPQCGTSRNTLALIRNAGVEPEVITYLTTPPSKQRLIELITAMALPVREIMRHKESLYEELNLGDPKKSDEELIDAMLAHPILMNRPIVVTPFGVRLCRPSERLLEILPLAQKAEFVKEDGEKVIDAQGRQISKLA